VIPLTLTEIAAITGGTLVGPGPGLAGRIVSAPVEFDSRKLQPGGLFAAFVGERLDGHDFAEKAIADGATAVLGSRAVPGVPTVLVADPRAAMGRLARAVVDRLTELTVVGLTGSSGKTTTKDMLARLLAGLAPTVATEGSLNNELGAPYTALQATAATRFLVVEMGARGLGHLRYLCDIVPPRIAVVINVGVAHIGEFGSVEGIAQAKGELVEALPAGGVAVLNADDPRVRAMAGRTKARVVLAGEADDAQVRAIDVVATKGGLYQYTLKTGEDAQPVRLGWAGRHQVGNSLLAAAVALEAGAPIQQVAAALGALRPVSSRRMDVFERVDGVTVIDDSYNANPASMAAALRTLVAIGTGRRTFAVLGSMAELGAFEEAGHEEVGRLAAELGVDRVVAVGEQAAPIDRGAKATKAAVRWGGSSVLVTDQEAAVALLRDELRPGDVVLVKGSRYRTWDVVDALRPEQPEAHS
jgi:UDP-N-acetylmuramoyl-tripeptide--D-alanyl-D-alanine ligase